MHCTKFSWNWPSGSGEEDFLTLSTYFCYFVIIFPWKRTGPFIWTNLKPLHPSVHCVMLSRNWLSGSGEEDLIISWFHAFLLFRNYLPLEKGRTLHLHKLESRMLCAKFGWNWPSGFWQEVENRKSLQSDRQAIRKAHLSFQLRWAKKTGVYSNTNTFTNNPFISEQSYTFRFKDLFIIRTMYFIKNL